MDQKAKNIGIKAVFTRFIAILLPTMLIVFAVTLWRNHELGMKERRIIEHDDRHHLELHKRGIIEDFQMVITDLIFLSNMAEFQNLFQGNLGAINELLEEWKVLCKVKKVYKEISFLNEGGKEIIAVYFEDGKITTVTEGHDLSSEERLLFQQTLQLRLGEVYVSPFSIIRKKRGTKQTVEKIIYFGTPIYNIKTSQVKGSLFIQYYADNLVYNLDSRSIESYHGQAMFLDSKGDLLFHTIPERKWGGNGKNDLSFTKEFPDAWQKISNTKLGQFYNSKGTMFTFDTVYPLWEARKSSAILDDTLNQQGKQIESIHWKLVHRVSPEVLKINLLDSRTLTINGLLTIMFAIGSWLLAYLNAKRRQVEKNLKKAHDELEIKIKERTADLVKTNQQLHKLSNYLQTIREEERTHIAREIHDELGQLLTATQLELRNLTNKLPQDKKYLREKAGSIAKIIDSSIQTVKKISADLRPCILDDLGLVPALEDYAEEFQARTGIACELVFDADEIALDKNCSTAVFRIFQESFTNVARHARASKITAHMAKENNSLMLQISDNGRGNVKKNIVSAESFGLLGMKERAQSVGGEIEINSVEGKGTTITLTIPIPTKGEQPR